MALVYFDSSAFVKLVVEEDGTDLAVELWDGCDAAFSSRIAYPEVRAALAAAARNHDLDPAGLSAAKRAWARYWPAVRPVELTAAVERLAGDLSERHRLRGADAVHLASALSLGDGGLLVATWDRRLGDGVVGAGLALTPSSS
ncbi:MAG: type II toxin-antitoxin system VapC family toxin [Acidimicrobiia bacterium]